MVDSSVHSFHTSVRTKPYVVGYSGCIPGMNFRYGQTFGKAAEDCVAVFAKQQAQRQARMEAEEKRAKSLPRMRSTRSRPYDVSGDNSHSSFSVYGRSSAMYPPIPGYTGYIPHLKCTDMGIGRTYGAAARKGIQRVMSARERRHAHMNHRDIL